jgi:hypothetical protein
MPDELQVEAKVKYQPLQVKTKNKKYLDIQQDGAYGHYKNLSFSCP